MIQVKKSDKRSFILNGIILLAFVCAFQTGVPAQVQETGKITEKHLVEARETFYSISKLYNVSIDELKAANPGVVYPKTGEYLNIPVKQPETDRVSTSPESKQAEKEPRSDEDCRKDKRNLSRTYNVALMVPLSLEAVTGIDTLLSKSPAEMMSLPPFRFIQFYQGFLMAADTLVDKGLNLELTIIDADGDQSKADRALKSESMQEMDLIVGPFFKNAFSETAAFAKAHDIPVVNPLSSREDILAGNPNVFKIIPSRISQVSILESLVDRRFRNSNIFIVTENAIQGADFVDSISFRLAELLKKSIPVVNYASDSLPGVRHLLKNGAQNLVILYSENGVLPVQLLPTLTEMRKDMEITIIGLPEWEKLEHMENKYLVTLGAYLFTDSYIDYTAPEVKQFITDFRMRFQAEPLEYAFDGYDAGLYFLSSLMDYGPDFAGCTLNADYPLLHSKYLFEKIPGGGYDNTYWNVYYFQDYYLVKVPYLPKSDH